MDMEDVKKYIDEAGLHHGVYNPRNLLNLPLYCDPTLAIIGFVIFGIGVPLYVAWDMYRTVREARKLAREEDKRTEE